MTAISHSAVIGFSELTDCNQLWIQVVNATQCSPLAEGVFA